jgi:hypothetical protein
VVDRRIANTAFAATKGEESIQSIGKLIQDLFHSDNAKVNAALEALFLDLDVDLDENKKKCENIHAVGGCHALVQLMKYCLDKAITIIPACDQDTELNELIELTALDDTLHAIISLICHLDELGAKLLLRRLAEWKLLSR